MSTDQPRSNRCPACNAAPNEFCTQATNTGRRDVKWEHCARIDARKA